MEIKPSDILQNLLNTGADASLNLFEISFVLPEGSDISDDVASNYARRITDVTGLVSRDSLTISVPYRNVNVDIISPGTEISKTIQFTIRVDDNYEFIRALRSLQLIDNYGNFSYDESKLIKTITISALKPNENTYISVYDWKFHNCYITKIDPISYSYNSAGQATTNVSFIWESYEE